jgi:hypothetical protein
VRARDIRILALTGLVAAFIGACGQTGGRVVVKVGAGRITEGELRHWTSVLAAATRPKPGERPRVRREALEFLIKARWVEEAARSDRIVVPRSESSKLLTLVVYAKRRNLPAVTFGWEDELERYLDSPTVTSTDQAWLMNLSLLHSQLEHRNLESIGAMISRSRVRRYYDESRRQFTIPESRDLAIVEASSLSAMQNARRALMAGVPPQVVAKRFSEGPYDAGGLKMHYVKQPGREALDRAIFSAAPHVVVGPLRLYWYYVFEVLKVHPARRQRLVDVEKKIRLTLAKRERAAKLDARLAQNWSPQTVCQPGYLVAGCR